MSEPAESASGSAAVRQLAAQVADAVRDAIRGYKDCSECYATTSELVAVILPIFEGQLAALREERDAARHLLAEAAQRINCAVTALEGQLAALREERAAFHRRAQQAEAACAKAATVGGPSIGRALANAGYRHWQDRAEAAESALAAAQQAHGALREERDALNEEVWELKARIANALT